MPKPTTRANPKPVIDADGEARALTASEVARFRPAEDVLPKTLLVKLNARRAQKAPVKEQSRFACRQRSFRDSVRRVTAGRRALMQRSKIGSSHTKRRAFDCLIQFCCELGAAQQLRLREACLPISDTSLLAAA